MADKTDGLNAVSLLSIALVTSGMKSNARPS